MKIAIVVADFNQKITSRMYDVALETAKKLNLDLIHTSHVPGIFDMPLIIDKLLQRKDLDAVLTLGAVIKGQTKHDEVITNAVSARISKLSIKYQKPISLGISGPGMSERQAFARIRPVSERAVQAISSMAKELKRIK